MTRSHLSSSESTVQIAAGLFVRGKRVLVCRRLPGTHLEGTWEFPGGKVRTGESPTDALARELEEEVGLTPRRAVLYHRQEYRYPERPLEILFYLVTDATGEPRAREGQELRWVDVSELLCLSTPPANREVLRLLEAHTRDIRG